MAEPYSVLMSVYAAEDPTYMRLAMQSMWNQTVSPDEFVLVCDGPLGEGLEAVISEMLTEHTDDLRILRLPVNCGLGKALQAGLKVCRNNLIVRMDSDDISRPIRCELLMNAIIKDELDLVGGAIEEFECKPGDLGCIRRPPLNQVDIEIYARRRNPFNHMTVMFRRSAVMNAGGYEPLYRLEDYWLWVRMIASGARVGNVSDVVVDARVGAGMYARRSGVSYIRSQRELFSRMRGLGLVTRGQAFRAVVERAVAATVPDNILRDAYNWLLRDGR